MFGGHYPPQGEREEPESETVAVLSKRDDPIEWRYEQFKKHDFTDEQALVLAYTRNHEGNFLYHEDVARILERAKKKYEDAELARNIVFDLLS